MIDPITSLQQRPMRTLSSIVQESLHTLFQILLLSMLLLGIGGIVFKAIGADGWLPGLLQSAWDSGPAHLVLATSALFVGGMWIKRFLYRRPNVNNRTGDFLVFGCLALGIFFALRLTITGGL